jgi:hypothetical protein
MRDVDAEVVEAIDRVVEYAYYQVMLQDDLETAAKDVDLLVACLRLRWAQVHADMVPNEVRS